MQTDFQRSLDFVLQAEGGLSDSPNDPGGLTNHGVTNFEFQSWLKSQGLPLASVKDITDVQVETIYRSKYWDAIKGDFVAFPLCLVLFDTAVNMGVGRAYEFLNEAFGLGKVMSWTTETSNKYHASTPDDLTALADQILVLRHAFYQEIVANNPEENVFLAGWLARITHLKAAAGLD